ncbi:MAG: nitroreductase family protein [Candidatus Aenigmatarchaeota archaeon]|nr:nitroreductase family protein [Candidatus Aenigmarchaeota archaeon]
MKKNNFLLFFKKRRSIRCFIEKEIEKEKILKIIKIFKYLPSSLNSQPWKIFIINNKEKIKEVGEKLSKIHKYSYPILNAPLIAIVTVDQDLSKKHFVEDGSIAAFSLWLAASYLGLGSVWIAIYDPNSEERENIVRKVFSIPKKYRIICILPIGYPKEKPKKKQIRNINEIINFYNKRNLFI